MASRQQKEHFLAFLKTLGLENYYPNKLTLKSLLEINSASLSDEDVPSLQEIPQTFLRKLLMVYSNSRSLISITGENEETEDLFDEQGCDATPNLLDVQAALFACADSFLRQEMALKMSMCQFAVPFVLPREGHDPCTFMLWALRGILKDWRPHSMSESRGFVEDSVVHATIPLISFVRLNNCSLSKSQVLNQVLSNSQQHHDIFYHRDMIGGSAPRVIANGLTEICWSLPCGESSIDVFPEAVAVVNLRGDACTFDMQFSFLTQVSAAVFVFLDSVEETEKKLLASFKEIKPKLFLVVNSQGNMSQNVKSSIKAVVDTLQLDKEHVIIKRQNVNLAALAKQIISSIEKLLRAGCSSLSIDSMKGVAQELGLAVDEDHSKASIAAELMAEKVVKTIGVRQIMEYKERQLGLQGENWKTLAKLEKEQCRLHNSAEMSLEKYKVKLQKDIEEIWNKQSRCKPTKTMEMFIGDLLGSTDTERAFFLKWLGLKLDMRSRKHMSNLRRKYKECEGKKDKDAMAKLDQEIIDCSLGTEHYMREMGLMYESALHGSNKPSNKISSLPTMAAKLLLDGFPLELLDGDASNIPEKWVSDVLMELHRMVGEKSRLLVVTVLGVQSTGKSTLLNTMFGVQFAVSSGRCTRGAYMILLPVSNNMTEGLLCDFILLIDTEGLKSPALAQLEDSHEHDNELATFVIGLSDIAIVNVAMENSTEMKDILQIAVHAFLRMKEVGKKTVCHFVHQNVAGVTAFEKTKTDRRKLLDQLNEMTVIAAEMEKQPHIKKFTDVLDYDVEKNNWYVPGLWHGTPPMAPVNSGYSVAVLDFKKKLLEMVKARNEEELSPIPVFLEWMRSLWKAVKFENFIFSFRNSLVAHAYDNLCKEFSEWEWSFKRHMFPLISRAEVQISYSESGSDHEVVDALKKDLDEEILLQTKAVTEKLKEFYKRKNCNVHLVEKYKADFTRSITSLKTEIKDEVKKRLNVALEMKRNKEKVEEIHRKQAAMIESQVLNLLQNSKDQKSELSDKDLKDKFEKMWKKEVVNITGLEVRNVHSDVLKQLRASLGNQKASEDWHEVTDLTRYGQEKFEATKSHLKMGVGLAKVKMLFSKVSMKKDLQIIADDVIASCSRTIENFGQSKSDYQETFTKDVLDEIQGRLKKAGTQYNTKFELDLKLHVCGIAYRKFREMHRMYLAEQDPTKHIEKFKNQYIFDFIDLFRKRDQCQRKAQAFTQLCLKPAVTDFIDQSIGPDIVDAVLENKTTEYGSRTLFQYTIQKELLEESNFDDFEQYILHYENYVKDWIYNHIIECFSEDASLQKLKTKKLEIVIKKLTEAVETSAIDDNGSSLPNTVTSTTIMIRNLCKAMSDVISVSMSTVDRVLFQNTSCCEPFTKCLYESIEDLRQQIKKEISESTDITETMENVSVKPQEELFKKVFGCGVQCPFCKTPCEAGGKEHQLHHAAVHRPQGIGRYRYSRTGILCETICTSDVHGKRRFRNKDTNFQSHPYKDYRKIYPDWHIAPDMSIEASDYWKYVMATFNAQFAESYEAKPAVYPDEWNSITKEQALISLKLMFNIH